MPRYIDCEKACAEVDKGDLLVGNNAEFAKEIINRTPTADVAPKSEVAREIFEEIEAYMIDLVDITNTAYKEIGTATFAELKKKFTEDKE